MELSIKDLDRILETFDKFHDTVYEISNSLITIKDVLQGRFSESVFHYELEHLRDILLDVFGVENEAL